MNQIKTGNYIAQKRRSLNLTQEQLANKLDVSNKTISKWENGKCMPDYSIIQDLCETLHISITELMEGKDAAEEIPQANNEQILDLLHRTQELEKQRQVLSGAILIVLGIASNALSTSIGGSNVKDFLSGLLLGLSIVEMIAGLIIAVKNRKDK